jgi:beta-lactamase regulating signal transducer with metallopeptidase domain
MIAWAIETMIAMSALALLVLALRRPVAARCGAGWAYALWLLPVLRLVTPPLELLSADLADALPPLIVTLGGPADAGTLPQTSGLAWTDIIVVLWAVGAAGFFAWQCARYYAFHRHVEAETRPSYPGEFAGLPIVESRGVDGPLAIGLLRPRIVVPFEFLTRYGPAEQQLALHHEWIHHRRGDLWWNLLALALLAANWFNPLAWIAFRAFRADQELACDAAVLREQADDMRLAYGTALVKSASRPGLIAACPLNGSDQLKRRLKMMTSHRSTRLRSLAGGLIVAGTFATGLCLSAPTLAQEGAKEPVKERKIFIREIGKDGKRELPADIRELTAKCPEAQRLESDVKTGDASTEHRTRIIVCSKDGTAPTAQTREKLLAALEKAQADIGSSDDLSPERRAKVVEALRQEIERVRSGGK